MLNEIKGIKERCMNKARELSIALYCTGRRLRYERQGQGTTEYAILVGVLVVIAIVAVVAFRDNIQKLWTEITTNINDL